MLLCILSTASAGYCLGDYYKFTSKVAVTNCDGAISHCGFQCCTWRWCIFCDCTDDHFGLAVTCVALEAAKSLEEACELVAIALNVSAYHLAPCTQSQMADLWLDAGCGERLFCLTYLSSASDLQFQVGVIQGTLTLILLMCADKTHLCSYAEGRCFCSRKGSCHRRILSALRFLKVCQLLQVTSLTTYL